MLTPLTHDKFNIILKLVNRTFQGNIQCYKDDGDSDRTADAGDQLLVPLGTEGGKLILNGRKLPLNLQTQLYYNVIRPNFGSE
jgi:hypothetical protein